MKVLEKVGFVHVLGKGSHVVIKHKDGRRATIPIHGKEVPKGTFLAIIRDIEITKEDLISLSLKKNKKINFH